MTLYHVVHFFWLDTFYNVIHSLLFTQYILPWHLLFFIRDILPWHSLLFTSYIWAWYSLLFTTQFIHFFQLKRYSTMAVTFDQDTIPCYSLYLTQTFCHVIYFFQLQTFYNIIHPHLSTLDILPSSFSSDILSWIHVFFFFRHSAMNSLLFFFRHSAMNSLLFLLDLCHNSHTFELAS